MQQLLNGKFDNQLPRLGQLSREEQRMEAEMEEYMKGFKMKVHLMHFLIQIRLCYHMLLELTSSNCMSFA